MPKIPLNKNVYQAGKERIEYVFDNFERITLSFSAGKDSTVMLHMVMDEAIKRKTEYRRKLTHIIKCNTCLKSC